MTFETTRLYPHTPDTVFAAFSTPERLARWWGPAGFRNTFTRCDFVPGGRWIFTMHGPDGADYPNASTFAEIDAPHRLVIRHDCPPFFTLTVTLTAEAGQTRLTWEQAFDDDALAEKIRPIVEPSNEQNLDRLAAELQGPAA